MLGLNNLTTFSPSTVSYVIKQFYFEMWTYIKILNINCINRYIDRQIDRLIVGHIDIDLTQLSVRKFTIMAQLQFDCIVRSLLTMLIR